ncbi:hypothetical protein LTR53_011088 [Teratosphaeriaceae sp. CCFEE 6253]|nr:hypothetical protein LTR53_011088 [Teratosphaeriaceae sp. CCFEE 6253]
MPQLLNAFHILLACLASTSTLASPAPQRNDPIEAPVIIGYLPQLSCWSGGFTPGTPDLQNAANDVCNQVQRTVFGPTGYKSREARSLYEYPPTDNVWDQGQILAEVVRHAYPLCDAKWPHGFAMTMGQCLVGD